MSLGGNSKIDSRPFFANVKRATKFCFVASQRLSYQFITLSSLHPTASLASLDQILDGNKLAKGMYLARKARDREVFIYTLSKLSWRDCKRSRKGIHLTENRSNKRHVILMGVNARANYQMPV